MIELGLTQAIRDQWTELRTCAYRCPKCGTRIQACGGWVFCRCPPADRIGVAGTIYDERTWGMPMDDHYRFAVER